MVALGARRRPDGPGGVAPETEVLPRDGGHHVRGDIEGLRALAVVLVVLDHLLAWPRGGFVGVDVFFVISGFLITGLLLREQERTGRISFVDFFRRRIRRILPASLLVLLVTAIAAQVVFFASRAEQTLGDALWAVFFAGNWRFALQGADYLHANGPVSPLQHYWSLAVEEQFYVVWPLLLVGLLALTRLLRGRGRTAVALTGMSAVVAASFGWALHETATDPAWAYFSTFSRAWELGVGALIAIAAGVFRGLPRWSRTLLGWAGLGGIVASAFVVDAGQAFPAPWAVAPVVSAALVLVAGTGGRPAYLWPLLNPVSRYVGNVSYSLYLWHFPVIILLGSVLPAGARYDMVAVAVTALLAIASFHLVEQPVRRSDWLRPGAPPRRSPGLRLAAVAGFAVLAVLVDLVAMGQVPWAQTAAAGVPTAVTTSGDPYQGLVKDISAAVAASSWPALAPPMDQLGAKALVPEWITDQCLDVDDTTVARCSYGPATATHTAVLIGDSVGLSWMPGIRAALTGDGWRVQSLTLGQCPAVEISVTRSNDPQGFTQACDAHHVWVRQQLAKIHPDLLIMATAVNTLTRLADGATGVTAQTEWQQATATTLAHLDGLAGRIVDLEAPPEGPAMEQCATRFNSPAACLNSPSTLYKETSASESAAIGAYHGTTTASYVWTTDWFCDAKDRCPAFVGPNPVTADGTHLTQTYSQRLAGVLGPALLGR